MNPAGEMETPFERRARALLGASLGRIDARTRSRLNQARHAAVERARASRRAPWRAFRWWRSFTLLPAAGAVAAALLVAVMLWHRVPASGELPVLDAQPAAVEDLDLIADGDSLDLIEGWDGSFYEWAAAQGDAGGSNGSDGASSG